jgi:hypothetical protein
VVVVVKWLWQLIGGGDGEGGGGGGRQKAVAVEWR